MSVYINLYRVSLVGLSGDCMSNLFGIYNIQNGPNGGIYSALQGMLQANADFGVFC